MRVYIYESKGSYSCRAFVPMVASDVAASGEMHVFTIGAWDGHPQGPFEITREVFDEMIAEFEATETPMFIDYDHSAPARGDTRAAGWIHKLEVRGDELWATQIEWTPKAKQMLADGEYRFCSPWFTTAGATDRRTGEERGARLFNVALTNMPFFDGHQPIQASELRSTTVAANEEKQAMDEKLTAAIEAMSKASGMDPQAVVAKLFDMADKIGGDMRENADNEQPMEAAEDKPAEGESAPEEEEKPAGPMASEVEAARAEAARNDEIQRLASEVKRLSDALASREAADRAESQRRREAFVDSQIQSGVLLANERRAALTILASENGDALYAETFKQRKGFAAPGVVGIGFQAGEEPAEAPEVTNVDDFTASERIALNGLRRLGWSEQKCVSRIKAQRVS